MKRILFLVSSFIAAMNIDEAAHLEWQKYTHIRVDPDTHEITQHVRNPIHYQSYPLIKILSDKKKEQQRIKPLPKKEL